MRRATSLLWSTTAVTAMFAAASTAVAQTTTPPTPNTAQEYPAQSTGSPATQAAQQAEPPADQGNAIVVTGLRKSLQSARNIKRNSRQQIDAIVAEDIGKLPDLHTAAT